LIQYRYTHISLMKGLRALPYYWGIVWRGRPHKLEDEEFKNFAPGSLVQWFAFSSTSKQKEKTLAFMGSGAQTLFKIHCINGRSISNLSLYPIEDEVLLLSMTLLSFISCHQDGPVLNVELQEVQYWFGRQVLLWVDDNPPNNKQLMEQAERAGVSVVMKRSTEEAKLWLKDPDNADLLKCDRSRFRIITDLVRSETEKLNVTAGHDFVLWLRSLGYTENVGVFSSPESRAKAIDTWRSNAVLSPFTFYSDLEEVHKIVLFTVNT